MAQQLTPEDVNRAVTIAWCTSLFLAAALTVPVFAIHQVITGLTSMRVVAAVLTIPLAIGVYFAAGMSLVGLVGYLTRPQSPEPSDFTIMSVYYHPGLTVRLSLLAAVLITWTVLRLWYRKRGSASPTVA